MVRSLVQVFGFVMSHRTTVRDLQEQANVDKNDPTTRYISRNIADEPIDPTFADNTVSTSKYNFITFLPFFLFEMFSRVAYLYFLIQVRCSVPAAPPIFSCV